MRHFQLSLIAPLILILAVVLLVGCMPASGDEDWENKYETLKIENTILKANSETAQADIVYLKSALDELKVESDTPKGDYYIVKADYAILKSQYNTLKTDFDTLQTSYTALKTDYDSLKGDSILYNTALAAQITDYNSLKVSYDSLKNSYDTLIAMYNELAQLVSSATPVPPPTYPIPTPTPTYATWIDEYQATYGELPVVPDWMLELMPELEAGDRFRKGVIFLSAGAQYWARRSPTEKEMILETVLWLGGDPNDYLWEMEQRRPP